MPQKRIVQLNPLIQSGQPKSEKDDIFKDLQFLDDVFKGLPDIEDILKDLKAD